MSNELETKIERLEELKKVGFRKLQGDERLEYRTLIKELEGVEVEEEENPNEGETKSVQKPQKKVKENVGVVHVLDRNVRYKGKVWKRGEELTNDSENFEFFNSLGFLEFKIKQ